MTAVYYKCISKGDGNKVSANQRIFFIGYDFRPDAVIKITVDFNIDFIGMNITDCKAKT